jgi:hypothetical protein
MKATYGEVSTSEELSPEEAEKEDSNCYAVEQEDGKVKFFKIECREIFKDPITDDGTKKSATGLLWVDKNTDGEYVLFDKVTWEGESRGFLQTIYKDGEFHNTTDLTTIRQRVQSNI